MLYILYYKEILSTGLPLDHFNIPEHFKQIYLVQKLQQRKSNPFT